jgi:trk system potassium uptake protein TrkA
MKVIIVGGGKTLYFLCRNFAAKGYEVILVNRDREECVELARQLSAVVVCGDGSDPEILKEAGAMGADAVLAITAKDQDNLVICQLAKLQFGVSRVIALTNDPDNVDIFKKLDVSAFSTTHIVGSLIEQHTSFEQIASSMPIGEGKVNVTELLLEPGSPVAGSFLKDIALPENALVAVIIRNDKAMVPGGGNQLLAGDRLVLITLPENHGHVLKMIIGEQR